MEIRVVDHPLVSSRLTIMRDKRSTNDVFRAALSDLGMMLVYEARRDLSVDTFPVSTPVDQADGFRLTEPPLSFRLSAPGLAWWTQHCP